MTTKQLPFQSNSLDREYLYIEKLKLSPKSISFNPTPLIGSIYTFYKSDLGVYLYSFNPTPLIGSIYTVKESKQKIYLEVSIQLP